MSINPNIFKGYDIRATYPDQINEENIKTIVAAIYKFFQKDKPGQNLTVVVGTDMRTSSPSLTKTAIETLVSLGAHVIDIGMVSTPTFYFAVSHYGYEFGMQITASHNPPQYNGIKFVKRGPNGLIKIGKSTGMEEIKEMAINNDIALPSDTPGSVEKKEGILKDEVENALKIVGNPEIKKFKIVADTANAMGAQYLGALFDVVSQDLVKMNWELDGTFPAHQPDPLQASNLVDLQKRVLDEKADLGLAPDGDGDRLFFIDEKGNIVPPTIITSIVLSELLKDNPGETIYVDIRYLLTPKKIIEEKGGKMEITKVGHAFITEGMNKTGGIFAGESSAHYFFRATGNAESQMPVVLTILKVLTRENKPFSEVIEEYRRSFESGEINYEVTNAPEILDVIKEKYKDGQIELMDGVAISYPEWRFSVRTSNTEPLLRLNVEALNKALMEQKRDELKGVIDSSKK